MTGKKSESKDTYIIQGYDIRTKKVGPSGKAGRIFVPQGWVGKKVKVILIN